MFLFNARKFFPKGQTIRTLIKEIFTLGLYDADKSKKQKFLMDCTQQNRSKIYPILQGNLNVGRRVVLI